MFLYFFSLLLIIAQSTIKKLIIPFIFSENYYNGFSILTHLPQQDQL